MASHESRTTSLALLVGIGLALVLARIGRSALSFTSPSKVVVSPAANTDAAGAQSQVETPDPLILLDVDATRTTPSDPAALHAAIDGALPWRDMPADLAQTQDAPPASPQASLPNWVTWGHLNGARTAAQLTLPTTLSASDLSVYTTHSPESTTILLANRADRRIRTRLRVRLPRGIYTIERLRFSPMLAAYAGSGLKETQDQGETQTLHPNASAAAPGGTDDRAARLVRLEGQELAHSGTVKKEGNLEPGQVVLYRFVDQSKLFHLAWADTAWQLHLLAAVRRGPANRLRRMLQEAAPYIRGLRASGEGAGLIRRLTSIHHLLLAAAQAQSLHRDYQMRSTIDPDAGAALMGALERLIDSLSETGAALLRLVPQISIDNDPAGGQNVTVSLANTGTHDVATVKLGLQTSELPEGVACDPSDSAFFGTLKPGQTVRALFRLQYPAGTVILENRCVADVCYFAGGGPAHLRPRPW